MWLDYFLDEIYNKTKLNKYIDHNLNETEMTMMGNGF